MNTVKATALVLIAVVVCPVLLLTPDSHRVEAPIVETQIAGEDDMSMKKQQSGYRVKPALPVVHAIDESLPLAVETPEPSVTNPTASQSIDWLKVLYPEITRIAELENEPADTAFAELTTMLASDDPAVRRAAIEAVGDMIIPEVLPVLSTALGDPSPQVRVVALEALASQDNAAVAGSIELSLYDPVPKVRLAAIDALAALGAKTTVTALASLLSDPKASIRRHAVNALGDIGGEHAMTYLMQAQYDPVPAIRANATEILFEMKLEAAN